MDKQRKIKCDCGSVLAEGTATFGHIVTKAMVCGKCNFTTLTKEQAQKFVKLKQLHDIIDAERRIIKIGNSFGITLPDKMKELGLKVGSKVKTEALSENSFKIEIES